MAFRKELYIKAQEIIDRRRDDAEMKALGKARLFESIEPLYGKYRAEMISSVKDAVKTIDMNPKDAPEYIQKQKIRNLTAQQEIKTLLKKHGLAQDYLETKYFCPLCHDTGFYESRLCSCNIELVKKLAFEEAGKTSPLKFCRFEDFKLDYYSDKSDGGPSPREMMSGIFKFCKDYADNFDGAPANVLMRGETGLGKSHLSLSIAGEVISKGFTCFYNSAQNIFNELQKERFGKSDTSGQYEAMVLECDLLVIDDLGAEFSTQFTNAALYNIINTRINSALSTIISTNLNMKELEERYTRRISSRLIGEYSVLKFLGSDIRQLKSEL